MSFNMYVPTRILFGKGKIFELHNQSLPYKKALIVISKGKSVKENGTLDTACNELKLAGISYDIFDKVEANPSKNTVMKGAAFAKEMKSDLIVAIGGGSVMDAAKAIALMANNDGDYWDYIGSGTGKGKVPDNKPLPVIAITTTAGTGSEADAACVITNEETNEKTGYGNPDLFPRLAIIDPELMKTVPPKFTAYQGFDALFHSVECYISNKANLMSDMYALTAVKNIAEYLPRAVKNGEDMKARERVAFANTLSGVVMTISGCTSEHSIEHAMSAYHSSLPHGAGLIIISEAYYKHFINKHSCDKRFVDLAKAMGITEAKEPLEFIEALRKLKNDCGVANLKMSNYGITKDEIPKISQNALDTMGRLFLNDPAELSKADCIKILEEAYK